MFFFRNLVIILVRVCLLLPLRVCGFHHHCAVGGCVIILVQHFGFCHRDVTFICVKTIYISKLYIRSETKNQINVCQYTANLEL